MGTFLELSISPFLHLSIGDNDHSVPPRTVIRTKQGNIWENLHLTGHFIRIRWWLTEISDAISCMWIEMILPFLQHQNPYPTIWIMVERSQISACLRPLKAHSCHPCGHYLRTCALGAVTRTGREQISPGSVLPFPKSTCSVFSTLWPKYLGNKTTVDHHWGEERWKKGNTKKIIMLGILISMAGDL